MAQKPEQNAPLPLPGDRPWDEKVARMIRVDHAGEYGAARIYEGQLAVFGNRHKASPLIRHMKAQEDRHLQTFDTLIRENRVRPTLLSPFWHVAGFALGAATACMGERAAMACTAAVEEVIDDHYREQSEQLTGRNAALKATIDTFRAEEQEHRDTAIAHGAEDTPGYPLLSNAIKLGCRTAIWLAKRI